MRNCPKCTKEVGQDGRCNNTSCEAYSHKVLEEILEDGNLKCDGYDVRCQSMKATRRRQNTAYQDDESNWNTLCEDCQEETDAHWKDMWADYYSGLL